MVAKKLAGVVLGGLLGDLLEGVGPGQPPTQTFQAGPQAAPCSLGTHIG